jgi:ATP-binding cassette, subfamily B, bacterial
MTRRERLTALDDAVRVLTRGLHLALSATPGAAAAVAALVVVAGLMPVAQVWLTQQIVDRLATGVAADALVPLLALAALYALTLVVPAVLEPPRLALQARLEDRAVADVDRRLLHAAGQLCDGGRIERPAFGDTLRVTRAAIYAVPRLPELVLQRGLGALVPLVGVLALLASLHPLLPLALLAVALPHLLLGTRVEWRAYQAMVESSRAAREADYCVRLATEPALAREVRVLGLADWVLGRYRERSRAALAEVSRERTRGLRTAALFGVLHALVLAGGFWYVATEARAGALTLGALALYLAAVQQAEAQVFQLAIWGTLVGQSWREVRDVLGFLDSAGPTIALHEHGREAPVGAPQIAVRGVRFQYPEGTSPVLDGVDAVLPAGTITALVGLNGAGKSTLVKLLTRLYDPDGGAILLDGDALAAYDLGGLRRGAAVVYQDFARFALTAGENIAVGASDGGGRPAETAAAWAGADTVIARLPQGLDTPLTRQFVGGVDLSGGEWQRIALARAFVREAQLVILDEPTAALDAEAEEALFGRFRELLHGTTGLIISHRMATVRMADHIIVLEDGRVVEAGSHAELLARGGRYAQLYTTQASRYRDEPIE